MSTYRQRIDRLARHHLAFANCALNLRFAAVTVGSCGDSWKLRRVAGEANNMMENALSILIVIFSVQLQQTEISERKLFIFHLGNRVTNHGDMGTFSKPVLNPVPDRLTPCSKQVWEKYSYLHD